MTLSVPSAHASSKPSAMHVHKDRYSEAQNKGHFRVRSFLNRCQTTIPVLIAPLAQRHTTLSVPSAHTLPAGHPLCTLISTAEPELRKIATGQKSSRLLVD